MCVYNDRLYCPTRCADCRLCLTEYCVQHKTFITPYNIILHAFEHYIICRYLTASFELYIIFTWNRSRYPSRFTTHSNRKLLPARPRKKTKKINKSVTCCDYYTIWIATMIKSVCWSFGVDLDVLWTHAGAQSQVIIFLYKYWPQNDMGCRRTAYNHGHRTDTYIRTIIRNACCVHQTRARIAITYTCINKRRQRLLHIFYIFIAKNKIYYGSCSLRGLSFLKQIILYKIVYIINYIYIRGNRIPYSRVLLHIINTHKKDSRWT